ncbi:DNA repair protein RAD51 homolog 3-like isoform X2 [Trichogramma pretiosum]|uniref:DNA repair protein RAD51 homolog 3-like isoform X2 n=1 Tax=Trichogramma pretiosum TaxID=7493 RepID=UPI0006C9683B|nr:DNA repair protein RAD51 homolog 3-like isoform X2 [Trichogramma pretiosum]
MFQPVTTLDLPAQTIAELQSRGFHFIEDVLNSEDALRKIGLKKAELEKRLKIPHIAALDLWEYEKKRQKIGVCCLDLEAMLDDGFNCGVITEISGAPYTGKTQICMQLCISVQLNELYSGLNGRAIYIDTRSGASITRFKELIKGYNNFFGKIVLEESEVLKNIQLLSPSSLDEFLEAISYLKEAVDISFNGKQVKVIIIDSLSMPIICSIDDPSIRPIYFSKVLHDLNYIAIKHDIAIVITNEIVTHSDKDGNSSYASAGGHYVSEVVFNKLESTRISDDKFAIRLLKSPIMPEISVTFLVGINIIYI